MATISTFDDWVDQFNAWMKDIGFDRSLIGGYTFSEKFGDLESSEIEFGDYAGRPKWETVRQIPEQRIRDALINLIVYQGDTEFASVEQQRKLIECAPSEYDLRSYLRVTAEEMRHGWQMCHLLVKHFGNSGRREALKLLERRAYHNSRLLGAFNLNVEHWVDFYAYTQFQDRDGKYQLTMLSRSSFAPLACSMGPMLQEEVFHLFTGNSGLTRIMRAGRVPSALLQTYFNKWLPACFDLFGTDHSSSANWSYVWGLKGRFDEATARAPANKQTLNEDARGLYICECQNLIDVLNQHVPHGQPLLRLPSLKFNRRIGDDANQPYSIDGELLGVEEYDKHLAEMLPGPEDQAELEEIFKDPEWIVPVEVMQRA